MDSKKNVLITGCGHGLGFYAAQKLVSAGYRVFAGVRSLDSKNGLLKACDFSPNLHVIKMDVSKYEEIDQAVEQILAKYEKIDLLINNAGTIVLGPIDALLPEELEELFRVNFFSVVYLTQKVLPSMRQRREGHIITIGSIGGVESSSYLGAYAASKFAVEAMVDCWATTLHQWNIKVSLIQPGAMNTNIPNSLSYGSYYNSQALDPYKQLNANSAQFLKEILNQATHPSEIAQLIFEIAQDPNPKLRYQTSEFSKNLVAGHLVDPQKTVWVHNHRQFVDSMSGKPGDGK